MREWCPTTTRTIIPIQALWTVPRWTLGGPKSFSVDSTESVCRLGSFFIVRSPPVREDVQSAMQVIVGEVASRAVLPATVSCTKRGRRSSPRSAPVRSRRRCPAWAEESKPLVVLIDEIDTLIGDALVSVLRQLCAGYDQRPERFPQSVGVVRDPRRARLPYPVELWRDHHRGERVQHQGGVVASRRLLGDGDAGFCWPSTPRRLAKRLCRRQSRRCDVRRRASRGW